MSNFESILSRAVGTSPKPKPLPIGTYLCVLVSHKVDNHVGKNDSDKLSYVAKVLQPQGDVDAEQLAAVPGGWQNKSLVPQFWLTEEDIWRFEAFARDVGELEGLSNGEAISRMVGKQMLIHTKHRAGEGDKVYNDCDAFAKVA